MLMYSRCDVWFMWEEKWRLVCICKTSGMMRGCTSSVLFSARLWSWCSVVYWPWCTAQMQRSMLDAYPLARGTECQPETKGVPSNHTHTHSCDITSIMYSWSIVNLIRARRCMYRLMLCVSLPSRDDSSCFVRCWNAPSVRCVSVMLECTILICSLCPCELSLLLPQGWC